MSGLARARDLGLALAAGALVAAAGVGATHVVTDWRNPDPLPVGDRVQAAADAFLAGDHVYVAADAHDRVPPGDEARLEKLASASDPAVYVAVWESGESGFYLSGDAVDQLEREVGATGVYAVVEGPGEGFVDTRGGTIDPRPPDDFNGDPVLRITELIEAVDGHPVQDSDWDYWGGPGGAVAAGLLFGALALPCVLLIIGLARLVAGRRFRIVGGWW
jgi:hypothetical protein